MPAVSLHRCHNHREFVNLRQHSHNIFLQMSSKSSRPNRTLIEKHKHFIVGIYIVERDLIEGTN